MRRVRGSSPNVLLLSIGRRALRNKVLGYLAVATLQVDKIKSAVCFCDLFGVQEPRGRGQGVLVRRERNIEAEGEILVDAHLQMSYAREPNLGWARVQGYLCNRKLRFTLFFCRAQYRAIYG